MIPRWVKCLESSQYLRILFFSQYYRNADKYFIDVAASRVATDCLLKPYIQLPYSINLKDKLSPLHRIRNYRRYLFEMNL